VKINSELIATRYTAFKLTSSVTRADARKIYEPSSNKNGLCLLPE